MLPDLVPTIDRIMPTVPDLDALAQMQRDPAANRLASASPEADELQDLLTSALEHARELLSGEHEPADPQDRDPRQLATRLPFLALGGSAPPHAVLQQVAHLLRASPSSSSHRFVNQLFGGRENLAVAAEVLATIRNNSMYTFKAAGAQVLVERELIAHMGRKVGFERAEGSFCPGGSMANLLALLLARNAHFPDAREHGCRGELVAIYTSKEGHYSIQKAAGILGLGRSSVRTIPVDDRGRMRADRLRRCIAEDQEQGIRPVLVNATAGTTVRGAFDPLRDLAAVATAAGAWFHVDGALGATAVLSPSTRQLVDGLELADSISWNPHKMMGVPLQCSLLLVSRPSALAQSLDETADYLFQTDDASNDPGRRSIQCGRRNDALKLWAAWRRLGDEGFSARVDRQFALARFAASAIAADPSFVLIEEPSSINVCFRVRGVDPAALCEVLHRSGRLSIGHGLVGTQRALRLVCVNPEIGEPELRAILDEILQAATGLCERVADRS